MTWIQTYTGKAFQLDNPSAEDVDIDDILQGLSHMPRYAGQTIYSYSVLLHSLVVGILAIWHFRGLRSVCPVYLIHHCCRPGSVLDLSKWLADLTRDQKAYVRLCLWHDASEAYLMDLPNPIKRMLPDYKALENRVEAAIASALDLPPSETFLSPYGDDVCLKKALDNAALFAERECSTFFNVKPLPGWGESIPRNEPLERAATEILNGLIAWTFAMRSHREPQRGRFFTLIHRIKTRLINIVGLGRRKASLHVLPAEARRVARALDRALKQ